MKEENMTADDSGFKPWGRRMQRPSDFEILRKEHDILARKLDRIDENLSLHASDTVLTLDRIEKLQSKTRDNIFIIRKRTDDIEKLLENHDRMMRHGDLEMKE